MYTSCKRACAFDPPRIAQGPLPRIPLGLAPAAGPFCARFAAATRPRSGREAGAKRPAHPGKHQNPVCIEGPPVVVCCVCVCSVCVSCVCLSVYVCARACQEGKESATERKREESLQSV